MGNFFTLLSDGDPGLFSGYPVVDKCTGILSFGGISGRWSGSEVPLLHIPERLDWDRHPFPARSSFPSYQVPWRWRRLNTEQSGGLGRGLDPAKMAKGTDQEQGERSRNVYLDVSLSPCLQYDSHALFYSKRHFHSPSPQKNWADKAEHPAWHSTI